MTEIKSRQRTVEAIRQSCRALRSRQHADGHWRGDLFCDSTVNADYVFLLSFLGNADAEKIRKLADFILSEQLEDGGWPIYAHGPSEISATLKAYWALKFAGHRPDKPIMKRARERIQKLGGIHRINTFAKFYLALFGQYDWRGVPSIPPELMFLPSWSPFGPMDLSSWSRGIVIPLSIVSALRYQRKPPPHATLDELFPDERRYLPLRHTVSYEDILDRLWKASFFTLDTLQKVAGLDTLRGLRRPALRRAERWILDHQKDTAGLGAIFPTIVNAILAFKAMGYPDDHEVVQQELRELARYEIDRGDDIRMQPCLSPVWDTALSMIAMRRTGTPPDDHALQSAGRWLIDQEISIVGDWGAKVENPQPSGWCFEYNNPFYPDIDDTIMVLMALHDLKLEEDEDRAREDARMRGLGWILSLQCRNGGWGSFDKDNTKSFLTKLPFADHNAMIDPPTADITARTLECLAQYGFTKSDECVGDAVSFLRREQEPDGSWFGRWGVNYVYGTWQALKGLADIGEDMNAPYIRRAIEWLLSVQNEDEGWGETCETYHRPHQKGKGPSTPSQTSWAVMGLISAGLSDHTGVERGIRHLLDTQRTDGNWDESEFTGTGFPKIFYLEYTMYRLYFPVMALGMYQDALAKRRLPASAENPL